MLASSSRHALKSSHRTAFTTTLAGLGRASVSPCLSECTVTRQRRVASTQANQTQMVSPSRSGVYTFTPDTAFRGENRGTPLARFNMELGRLVERRLFFQAFQLCAQMKATGVKPTRATYDYILQACSHLAAALEAWAVMEDMVAVGIHPDRQAYHHLLHALRARQTAEMGKAWDQMLQNGIRPNETTYEIVILRMIERDELEVALQYLGEMNKAGLSPTLKTAQAIISSACKLGYPRLAIDLAGAFEQTSVRRLDPEYWMSCLIASAEVLYADGVLQTWDKVVRELGMIPDEGCCLDVLHTVGRHGLSALGMDVIRVLKGMGIIWQEHHFAPVVESFCHDGSLKEAFGVLSLMLSENIAPTQETAYPIFGIIRKNTDNVDEAWGILETMYEEGSKIGSAALNVIIQAAVALGDLQRAVGTYKQFPDLGVKATSETYNLLLAGCISAKHRELGDRLLTEMRDASVQPDARTYERLIILCLTQATYEDAFFYLEEMKSLKFIPTQAVYDAIIRKCVSVGDTRYKLAVDEMMDMGYVVDKNLKAFIDTGGEHGRTGSEHGRTGN